MTMINRRQWIDRLTTCKEEDLEYLTLLFQDWRQEELGEKPTPLLFELECNPYQWYAEGPNEVANNPIRKLTMDKVVYYSSLERQGYMYFHFSKLTIAYDVKMARKLTKMWFPPADIIHEPDDSYKVLRYYSLDTVIPTEIVHTVCTNALKWARKKSKRMKNKTPH